MDKLQWKVKHNVDFNEDFDFLETILTSNGVEDVMGFINPTSKYELDPFDLDNIREGIKILHDNIDKQIFIKVDSDVDGYTSASYIKQFIQKLNPNAKIDYRLDFNKGHGAKYEDVAYFNKDELGLIIIPDASITQEEAIKIQDNLGNVPILIIDHHKVEEDNAGLYNNTNTILINCMQGEYANKDLSGVGVVHKFCLAYCREYDINEDVANYFLDLVALGMICDSMNLLSLENRYYITQGLEPVNMHNEFMQELKLANADDMKFGFTIMNCGWTLGPRINGTIRYGKPEEQIDLFRAMSGEQEDREYQPRRKHKDDPKPPIEIHSLQKTMARVCGNVKQRQDTEVRNFMKKIDAIIEKKNLTQNSVLIIDGDEILTKKTVTGLVANKIASKYCRPCLILKTFNDEEFGGSGRNYNNSSIKNLGNLLQSSGLLECKGHDEAFGVFIPKENVEVLQQKCNELIPLDSLTTIHEVDYEIEADKIALLSVRNVANSYRIWGNNVSEPKFAIKNLRIKANNIAAYGENNGFIRFVFKGIPFIKKYCPKGDYEQMTLRDRRVLGTNNKELNLNLICSFVLNEYEGNISPQVKIWYYDSEEYKPSKDQEEEWVF